MYYKVRFLIGQTVFPLIISSMESSVTFEVQFLVDWTKTTEVIMIILQDHDVLKTQVKNPIHAVANVDDYSGSARLLAATTLRSSSFIVDFVIIVSVTITRCIIGWEYKGGNWWCLFIFRIDAINSNCCRFRMPIFPGFANQIR